MFKMTKDSKSNREKIYTTGGTPFFGKVYGYKALPQSPPHEPTVVAHSGSGGNGVDIFLTKYTATAIIWKSPASRCNKNKICSKGKTLYVIGDVCSTAGGDSETSEYLVFSEESWVFKRTWQEIAGLVVPAGNAVWRMDVTGTGSVKDRLPQHVLPSSSVLPTESSGKVRCDSGSSSNGNDNSNDGGDDVFCVNEMHPAKAAEDEGVDEGKMEKVGKGKKGRRGGRCRRNEETVQALRVQFTGNPMSAVWFTESGLRHMAALVASHQSSLWNIAQCDHVQEEEGEGEVGPLLEPSPSSSFSELCWGCCTPHSPGTQLLQGTSACELSFGSSPLHSGYLSLFFPDT